jgi:cellulose synthase/poly-beta-1,6-N-acetylglucosamine synthase-like glycosyltransferase
MKDASTVQIPSFAPVPADIRRPLWSVMIPSYNSGEYLRRTLQSVLAQDPGLERMQIEVVDHCSTADDPESLVRAVGGSRVAFYRRPKMRVLLPTSMHASKEAMGT